MKSIAAYILLGLFSFSLLQSGWPILDYVWNYDYIVTELCINRDKPEMQCNGQCHLKEQFAEVENSTSAGSDKSLPSAEYKTPLVFFQEIDDYNSLSSEELSEGIIPFLNRLHTTGKLTSPTPPPQIV